MKYKRELNAALEAAERAGEIMDRYRENGVDVMDTKDSHLDIVTAADHECQDEIVDILSSEFPQDGFIGEEQGLDDSSSNRTWIIDPIDGTTNFQRGFPYFCTSIALRIDDEIAVGVVHSPESALDRTFAAVQDFGAFEIMNDSRKDISVSEQGSLKGSLIMVSEADHAEDLQPLNQRFQYRIMENDGQLRRPGAAALDLCLLGTGAFDGVLLQPKIWDIAAGSLIVREAGGTVKIDEREHDNLIETVASNGKIQDVIVEKLEGSKHDTGVWFHEKG